MTTDPRADRRRLTSAMTILRTGTEPSELRRAALRAALRLASTLVVVGLLGAVAAPMSAQAAACGDGTLDVGEQCDDGNVVGGDCCDGNCNFEPDDGACDDADPCTADDVCYQGFCAGTPLCDDLIACTVDACDAQTLDCTNTPDDSYCDDDDVCTGTETCSPTLDCQAGAAFDCSVLDAPCVVGTCFDDGGNPSCVAEADSSPQCVDTPAEVEFDDDQDPSAAALTVQWEEDPGDQGVVVKGALKARIETTAAERIEVSVTVTATGLDGRSVGVPLKRKPIKIKPGKSKRVKVKLKKLPVQSDTLYTRAAISVSWQRDDDTTVVVPSPSRWLLYDAKYRTAELRGVEPPDEELAAEDLTSTDALGARLKALTANLFDPPGRMANPFDEKGKIVDVSEVREQESDFQVKMGGSIRIHTGPDLGPLSGGLFDRVPPYIPDLIVTQFSMCAVWPGQYVDAGFGEDLLGDSGLQYARASHSALRILSFTPGGPGPLPPAQIVFEGFLDRDGCTSLSLGEGNYVAILYPLWNVDGLYVQARRQLEPPRIGEGFERSRNPNYERIGPDVGYASAFSVSIAGLPVGGSTLVPVLHDHLTRAAAVVSTMIGGEDTGFDLYAADTERAIREFERGVDVVVSPDGAFVYVATDPPGFFSSVWAFERDAGSGLLSLRQRVRRFHAGFPPEMNNLQALAVSPDLSNVYATGEDDAVEVMTRMGLPDGHLAHASIHVDGEGGVDGIADATGIAVSDDGLSVYVASPIDHTLAVFTRDLVSGALALTEQHVDGVGGVDGLNFASVVALSPDGTSVYVAGNGRLATFARTPFVGTLIFVGHLRDFVGDVRGIGVAKGLVVSPDGNHVYTTGGDSVAAFSRSPTGDLSFVREYRDGDFGIAGLEQGSDLAISTDGANVYVTAETGDSLLVFDRHPTTGELTFVERQQDGVGGVDGLDGARAVAVSPDDAHVYTVSYDGSALSSFERATDGTLTFVDVQRDTEQQARRPITVAADQGCPGGSSLAEGWLNPIFGGCYQYGSVFVGQSPVDETARHLSYWKHVFAHEMGHLLADRLIARSTSGSYSASSSLTGLSPMCRCDHVSSANQAHCFQSLEDIGSALTEGLGQFFAAKAFNELGEGDCTFVYYKDFLTGIAAEDPTLAPPVAFDCQTPLRIMENFCDVAVPNEDNDEGGTEGDWMYFLWLAHENATAGASLDDLRTILEATLSDGDFIEAGELAPAALAHFGPTPQTAHFAASVVDSGID